MKLVERLVDVNTHEPPSEYESDVAAVRLSVATSQLEDFDPITPPPAAKLSTDLRTAKSRQALRAKMNLDGLIACRPQMPTPSCEPFVPSAYADATGMRHIFCCSLATQRSYILLLMFLFLFSIRNLRAPSADCRETLRHYWKLVAFYNPGPKIWRLSPKKILGGQKCAKFGLFQT